MFYMLEFNISNADNTGSFQSGTNTTNDMGPLDCCNKCSTRSTAAFIIDSQYGGFISNEPQVALKLKNDPRDPKNPSVSAYNEQNWRKYEFNGEAKHSNVTPKSSFNDSNSFLGNDCWSRAPSDWPGP